MRLDGSATSNRSILSVQLSSKIGHFLHALSLLFCNLINTLINHFGSYEPSSPSTKELHGLDLDESNSYVTRCWNKVPKFCKSSPKPSRSSFCNSDVCHRDKSRKTHVKTVLKKTGAKCLIPKKNKKIYCQIKVTKRRDPFLFWWVHKSCNDSSVKLQNTD